MKKLIVCAILIIVIILIIGKFGNEHNVFKKYYYFDSNGSTPIHKSALKEYNKYAYAGNASADYAKYMGSEDILKRAIDRVRSWTNTSDPGYSVIFNSGSSEGNNYVLRAASTIKPDGLRPHFILSALEHKTSLNCADSLDADITLIKPNAEGIIDPIIVAKNIKPNTVLISIMHANNEIGSVNNIAEIGKLTRDNNILFHSDVVQTFGKMPINMPDNNLDAITVSYHKLHGPLGTGLLVISKKFKNLTNNYAHVSGTQFDKLRGGTLNIPAIAAANKAMEITFHNRDKKNRAMQKLKALYLKELGKYLPIRSYTYMDNFKIDRPTGVLIGCPYKALPSTILLSFIKPEGIFNNLDIRKRMLDKGYIISVGSACNAKTNGENHIHIALGLPINLQKGAIRVSFNDYTTRHEVRKLAKNLAETLLEIS
jgi:cysteine desulfurase